MKKPAKNNNMYLEAKTSALGPYGFAVEGPIDAAVCVVFAEELSHEARAALAAACGGIGMSEPVLLDISVLALEDDAPDAREGDGSVRKRPGYDVFAALEALDPIAVIVADAHAAELLSRAYREPIVADAHGFFFGRPYAAFASFQRDLADSRAKQRNWALIKAMRKSADWLG